VTCLFEERVHAAVSIVLHHNERRVEADAAEAHEVGMVEARQEGNLLDERILCVSGVTRAECSRWWCGVAFWCVS
jgi:hypothetical protein